MNFTQRMIALCFALFAGGAAWAGDANSAENQPVAAPAAPASRAEVLAELQIWRVSGMAELNNGEVGLADTPAYDLAAARYAALRSAPSFAALVMRIAQGLGEKVTLAAAR